MTPMLWALVWLAVIAVVALLAVREIRSGRKGPGDFDRLRHSATAEAQTRETTGGPGNTSQIGFGG